MGQTEQLPCARPPSVRQSDSVCEWAQSRVPHSILIVEGAPERPWPGLLSNAGKGQPRTAPGTGGAEGWSAVPRAPHGQGGNSLGWCRVTRAAASGSRWGDCHNSDGTPQPFKFWDTGLPHGWSKALGGYRDSHPQRCHFRQTYFEDNPKDLQLLRHDLPLHPAVVKPHLGHVPDYLGEWARGGSSVCHRNKLFADSVAGSWGIRVASAARRPRDPRHTQGQVAVSIEPRAGHGLGVTGPDMWRCAGEATTKQCKDQRGVT